MWRRAELLSGLVDLLTRVWRKEVVEDRIALNSRAAGGPASVENPSEAIRNVHENVKRKFQPNILDESLSYKKLKIDSDKIKISNDYYVFSQKI